MKFSSLILVASLLSSSFGYASGLTEILSFSGVTQFASGGESYCRVQIYQEDSAVEGSPIWIEYANGNGGVTFGDTSKNEKNVWKGSFAKEVPGSGGDWGYAPAEKSSGRIEVALDARTGLLVAKVIGKSCVERTLLGHGTGLFKCEKFDQVCTEEK